MALVLSRQRDQYIDITDTQSGEVVSVFIVAIRGDKVRLGIEASERFEVDRREIKERLNRLGFVRKYVPGTKERREARS